MTLKLLSFLKNKSIQTSIVCWLLLSFTGSMQAQDISVNAKLDSILMFIGGQMDLTLEVNQPQGVKINFPLFTDTINKNIEVVERGKIDTISTQGGRIQLIQKYRITSFDSGVHYVPAIVFELANNTARKLATQPMALKVVNPFANVDPEKGIFDIKKPINTPFTMSELKPYIIYAVGFILIVGGLIFFMIWRFNRKLLIPFLKKEIPIDPPHVIALRELNRIKDEKLWQRDQTKKYYSQLTDVIRQYIEVRFNIKALEQTTDETIHALKKVESIENNDREQVKEILQLADLVKFAKFKPLQNENDLCLSNSILFVNHTKMEEIKPLEIEQPIMKESETTNTISENNKTI